MKIADVIKISVSICAVLSAGCETALERPLEKEKVVLTAPADNITAPATEQTFYWEPVEGATAYQLQVVSPRFSEIRRFVMDTAILKNNFTATLDTGTYQWRVMGFNNSSSTDFSEINTLFIK